MLALPLEVGTSSQTILLNVAQCPNCNRIVVSVGQMKPQRPGQILVYETLVWPQTVGRNPAPPDVPADIASDYQEAATIVALSPKASAAISRRCLQSVLRQQGFAQRDLAQQIEAALPTLPSYIADNVDAVRNIGNFAAHPLKATASNSILEVEPGEAEWTLDVLDSLFDFYYVQPRLAQQKRDALNAKLNAAGKPPLK